MKRQVCIFIETEPSQLDSEFTRLELFNDEKISVSSTIQNISDISKIFTDFSQGFTIPCSPINNAVFQHFYQNDVDATISYQFRFNAFIEIDTTLFRRGKIQFEKANLKNGKPDSYSLTFYGIGVSLKDHFLEDKLSQLDYSTLDHDYTNTEIHKRVTLPVSTADYNVRYPLITSKRVWQYDAVIPSLSPPSWYTQSNANDLHHASGEIIYTELFPAVRVASIFELIELQYGITFNGVFLLSDSFKKAFLLFKNKDKMITITQGQLVLIQTFTATYVVPTNFGNCFTSSGPLDGTFRTIYLEPFLGGALNDEYGAVTHNLYVEVTAVSSVIIFYIDIYLNNVFQNSVQRANTSPYTLLIGNLTQTPANNNVYSFKIRSQSPMSVTMNLKYVLSYELYLINWQTYTSTGIATCNVVTTLLNTDLASLAPDIKINDFVTGICKEFNLTVHSKTKNVYTFDTVPFWYSNGAVIDITKFTDITSIEVERVKLYKSIEFKYQDSESFMNRAFLESPLNVNAHQYGNLKMGFNFDGGEYQIETPFENLLHCNFGNQLQVGYCLNKEFSPYVPKPVLLYMNVLTTITGGGHIHWNGMANVTDYIPFGQDAEVLLSSGTFALSLNFGAEISSFYNETNLNSLYKLYYESYLSNLYNAKNRLTKVKTILPVSLLTELKLNDRLIIRDKRYLINEMQSDLTTGDVSFTLLNDFTPVQPIKFEDTPIGDNNVLQFMIGLTNGVSEIGVTKSANAGNVTLSQVKFEEDGLLNVTVPANAARTITITLSSVFTNGNSSLNYIIIYQI